MRTVFLCGETELYTETRGVLVKRFSTWCEQQGADPASMLLEFLLDDKLVRDGLLARWTERDLQRFLVEVVPRRLILDDRWSAIPKFLHQWLDFLDDAGLLMSAGASVRELHAAVDLAVPDYLAAMAEPAEWAPAKFWSVMMREHGVDPDDEEDVNRFLAAVDSGEVQVDEKVADDAEDREALEPLVAPAYWLPPVPPPDETVLAAEAPATAVVAKMRVVHEWLGEGRKVGETGELADSDLSELADMLACDRFEAEVLLAWAEYGDLIRRAGGRLVRRHISATLLEEPALLWTRLWQSFVLLDDVFGADDGELDPLGEGADIFLELVQAALRALCSRAGGVPLELVVDLTISGLLDDEEHEAPSSARKAVRRMFSRVLDQWEALGVVRRFVATDSESVASIDAALPRGAEPDHTVLEPRPLGRWAARGSLQAFGFVVPTVDEMVRYPAEVLVLAISDSSEDVAEEVAAAWLEHRGAPAASTELLALLRRLDEPAVRLGAFWMFGLMGADGIAAAQELREDPVTGAVARMWLRTRLTSDGVTLRPGDELMFLLDGMAVTAAEDADALLSEFRQQPTAEQIAMIDEIARSPHSRVSTVLRAIADGHPDERVANAALRSLGAAREADARS
jgi:hypothetical protein